MARNNKINLPSSGGGLTGFGGDGTSTITFKPSVVIVLVIIVIILEIFLHTQGLKILGLA
jgi:hypothetical protein